MSNFGATSPPTHCYGATSSFTHGIRLVLPFRAAWLSFWSLGIVCRFMISWQNKSVRVEARTVPRFMWTTASIDVYLGEECVLRTGGKVDFKGTYSTSFNFDGSEHRADLTWGLCRQRHFPYQLRIDGRLIDESRVQVKNFQLVYIPVSIVIALLFVFIRYILPHLFSHTA